MLNKKRLHQNSYSDPSSTPINWLSLWQMSGNDWTWMLKQDYSSDAHPPLKKKGAGSHKKILMLELMVTIALLFLVKHLESSKQFFPSHYENTKFFETSIIEPEMQPNNNLWFQGKE